MIICFSGTGNTRLCADLLSKALGDQVHHLRARDLRDPASFKTSDLPRDTKDMPESARDKVSDNKRVIWMFPVYSWGMPPVFERFMNEAQLNFSRDTLHYMVCTCGDDIGLTAKLWRKTMGKRGWQTAAAFSVQMPNTYVFMKGFDVDKPEVAQAKLNAAPTRVRHIAAAIDNHSRAVAEALDNLGHTNETVDAGMIPVMPDDVVTGGFAWIKSHIIRPWFMRFAMSPKPFHATDACTGCGLCARSCPMANITMKPSASDSKRTEKPSAVGKSTSDLTSRGRVHPTWGPNCALCTACYHVCPHHAVAYGTTTRSKGQKPLL